MTKAQDYTPFLKRKIKLRIVASFAAHHCRLSFTPFAPWNDMISRQSEVWSSDPFCIWYVLHEDTAVNASQTHLTGLRI